MVLLLKLKCLKENGWRGHFLVKVRRELEIVCEERGRERGPARNSDTSLFRRLNGPKYFPLDRHVTIPTVQCSENETHWSEGPLVRLFEKEAH